ncbi:DUF1054 family protein [Pediococcus ethanolidurans]
MEFRDQLFSAFEKTDVQERLKLIRLRTDPFFEEVIQEILTILNKDDLRYHSFIAKHARRHLNPPPNTWVAFGKNNRGYKMVPHYEIGVWDDRLFLWLAFETNIKEREAAIESLQVKQGAFLNSHFLLNLSTNHMVKPFVDINKENYSQSVKNYQRKKQAEVLIGRVFLKNNRYLDNKEQTLRIVKQTILTLSQIWDK